MLPLRIMDQNFNLLGEIDKYSSLQLTRSHFGVGSCELRINRYMKYTEKLTRRNIIFPYNQLHKPYMIMHKEIELDQNGKATENWIIKCLSLKAITAQRVIYPTSGAEYNVVEGDMETVLKHYVNTEMINPIDQNRIYQNLVLAPNQNRGSTISIKVRYENLADKIAELAILNNMGWNIELDLQNKKYRFDVIEGIDRTENQSVIPPVIFSTEYETLESITYAESDLEYKNVAVVGGKGEGLDRRIIEVGTAIGKDRFELFVDANVDEEMTVEDSNEKLPRPEEDIIADLEKEGQNALNEHAQEIYLEGQILAKSKYKYEQHYNVGDEVTIQNIDWGVTLDTVITSVKEIYEPGKQKNELIFDNDRPTLISKVKKEIKKVSKDIRR